MTPAGWLGRAALGLAAGAACAAASLAAATATFELLQRLPPRADGGFDAGAAAMNVLGPAAAGVLVALVTRRLRTRHAPLRPALAQHLAWYACWYAAAAAGVAIIAANWSNRDFWLFGQLVLWPTVAWTAGIATDLLLAARASRGGGPAS